MAGVLQVRRQPGRRAGDHDPVHPVGAGAQGAPQARGAELEGAGEAVGEVGVLAALGGGDERLELRAGLLVGVLGGPRAGALEQRVVRSVMGARYPGAALSAGAGRICP